MAALTAAQNGADVLLLEQNEIIGRKILSTGNGRCNFTNRFQDPSCYRSDNSGFAWKSIGKFSEPETTSFFKNLGIYPKDKNGYLYPWSEQASAVREALESALKLAKIRIHTGVRVFGIIPKKNGFQISFSKDGKKGMISGEAVILAAGSKAAAKLGTEVDMTWQKCWDISWFRLSRLWYSFGAGKSCTGKLQACVLMEK